MVTSIFADTTPLLEAIAATDERAIIDETLNLLAQDRVVATKVAGSPGLAALWGACDRRALRALAAAGSMVPWLKSIPLGPELDGEERRRLAPALPLVQAFLAASAAIRQGMGDEHPALPEALLPAEVRSPAGPLGGVRDGLAAGDVPGIQRILLGYDATGADYRELLTTVYAALATSYRDAGAPLMDAYAAARVCDVADWGGNQPAFIAWYTPHMPGTGGETAVGEVATRFAAAPENDLKWMRTRLAIPREEAAGPVYQTALFAGDEADACTATLRALRDGATPRGVAAAQALAAATKVAAAPEGDRAALLHAGYVLLYVHAVHDAMLRTQDPNTWPLLYTAAAAVNSLRGYGSTPLLESRSSAVSSPMAGGLIAPTMLRSLEHHLGEGDGPAALVTARRYVQMGHEPRALAGVLGGIAAMHDIRPDDEASLAAMPLVEAVAAEYLTLPRALANNGQNALLTAGVRLATDLRGPHATADRVRAAIDARLASVPAR